MDSVLAPIHIAQWNFIMRRKSRAWASEHRANYHAGGEACVAQTSLCGIRSSSTKRECIYLGVRSQQSVYQARWMAETSAVDEIAKRRLRCGVCLSFSVYIFVRCLLCCFASIDPRVLVVPWPWSFKATFLFLFLSWSQTYTLSLCSVFVRGWTDPTNKRTGGRTERTKTHRDGLPTNQPTRPFFFCPRHWLCSLLCVICVWPKPCSCSCAWKDGELFFFPFLFLRGEREKEDDVMLDG